MRIYRTLLAGLCLLATAAVYGQTASLQQPSHNTKGKLGAMSFSYDAQHDQIVPNGMQLQPHASNTPITPTTGKIVVTATINAETHFPMGTKFHCTLLAVGGELDTTNCVIAGGLETTSAVAKHDVCTLTIPYSWIVPPDPAAATGLILAIGVSAVEGDGHHDHDDGNGAGMVTRTTLQVLGVDNLPANGTTTTVSFDIVL
jgi:hypothetical protein